MNTKTVIVTGAAGGIGQAICRRCLAAKARVLACDVRSKELQLLASNVADEHLETFVVDVTQFESVRKFWDVLKQKNLYPTDLINNAGVYFGKSFMDYSVEQIDHVIAVNVKGAIYFSQLFGKTLLEWKQPGSIVTLSSVSAQEASSDALYGLTKAALLGLTKSLALTFSPYIRVNAITPGIVETELIKNIPKDRLQEFRQSELVKTPILPEDVAESVWFLINETSGKHYTGATLDLNNGCYLR